MFKTRVVRHRTVFWRSAAICASMALLQLASCTDLILAAHRDDAFLHSYQYPLGEQYITVNGLKICYQEHGQGPDLVIVPGLGTSIDFWRLNIPKLAEHYHVVAMDLPGFGKSDKPDADYELPWLRDQIVAFMDAKGIRQAHLVGGSMGGHLAVMVALDYPQRVDKMVLMGSSGTWPKPGIPVTVAIHTLWHHWVITDHMRRNWPAIFDKLFSTDTQVTQELRRYQLALRANAKAYAAEGRASSRALRSIFLNSCRDRLKEVKHPTLLLWGENDHFHLSHEALYFRDHLSNARLVFVSGTSHEVMIDRADTFNELTLTFLDRGTFAIKEDLTPE